MPVETPEPTIEPTPPTIDPKGLIDRGGPYVDEDPFHRNPVDTTITDKTVPDHPSANLERESNYSKNEEIKALIERVRSGAWAQDQRTQELQRRYGNRRLNGTIQQMRMWLGGEQDFTYDPATGRMVYHAGTEIARRAANVGWKTAKTAAFTLLAGTLTGGIGGASYAAIAGSSLGRTFAESWRGITGEERRMREEIMLSRERYYEKALELADRIGPEEPVGIVDPDEIARYHETRHAAIKDLVNFVHASEQHGVLLRQDEHGVPYIASRVIGEPTFDADGNPMPIPPLNPMHPRGISAEGDPIPVEEFEDNLIPGEPRPGGAAGPAMVTGTEVLQPSDVTPTTRTIDDMQKELEDYRNRLDVIEEALALAGGIGAGIAGFLHAKAGLAAEMTRRLANGEIVNLDLNGDGIYHGVQSVTEAIKDRLDIAKNFVFHYATSAEAIQAAADNATVLPFGENNSHILEESLDQVVKGINNEAIRQAARGAIPGLLALITRYVWRHHTNENQHRHFNESTADMNTQQEVERRRYLPDSSSAEMHDRTTENLKPDPAIGDEWVYGDTDDWHKIKITSIIREGNDTKIRYEMWDPELKANVDRIMSIDALLRLPNVDCIKKPPVEKKEEEKKKVGLFDRKAKLFDKDGKVTGEVEVLPDQIFMVKSGKVSGYWEVSKDKDDNVILKKLRYDKATKTLDYDPKAPEMKYKNIEEFEIWTKWTLATLEFPNKVELKKELDK